MMMLHSATFVIDEVEPSPSTSMQLHPDFKGPRFYAITFDMYN
jgi:hypothetical protein